MYEATIQNHHRWKLTSRFQSLYSWQHYELGHHHFNILMLSPCLLLSDIKHYEKGLRNLQSPSSSPKRGQQHYWIWRTTSLRRSSKQFSLLLHFFSFSQILKVNKEKSTRRQRNSSLYFALKFSTFLSIVWNQVGIKCSFKYKTLKRN